MERCVSDIANSKRKSIFMLFDTVEQEINDKTVFVSNQKRQVTDMENQLEFLIERREVVNKAKNVIFGKEKKPGMLSGEVESVNSFLQGVRGDNPGANYGNMGIDSGSDDDEA